MLGLPTSIHKIAPLPGIAVEILNRVPTIATEGTDLRALLDPETRLMAEVVRVAMRTDAGKAAGVTPDTILQDLSPPSLAELALTITLRDYMRRTFDVAQGWRYWRYTLACAFCCAEIGPASARKRLAAYSAGLLHDIGRLALMASYPDRYSNLLILMDRTLRNGQTFDISRQEVLLFGLDRFATGAWLAAAWSLPAWLRPVVGKFDQALADPEDLVATVRAGTRLANSLRFGYLDSAPRMEIRKILSSLPAAFDYWNELDRWQTGEQRMRAKIQAGLNLFGGSPQSIS